MSFETFILSTITALSSLLIFLLADEPEVFNPTIKILCLALAFAHFVHALFGATP